jgi:hypothetical protein
MVTSFSLGSAKALNFADGGGESSAALMESTKKALSGERAEIGGE